MKWRMMEPLEVLDFSDDICMMSYTQTYAQEKKKIERKIYKENRFKNIWGENKGNGCKW